MFSILILRSFVKQFVIWLNPKASALAGNNRWTARQLYLEAKGDRAQHKILEMATRNLQ
jgi:hypothetical protein